MNVPESIIVTARYHTLPHPARAVVVVRWLSQGETCTAEVPWRPSSVSPYRVAVAEALDLGEVLDGTHSSMSTTRKGATIQEAGGVGMRAGHYVAYRYRVTPGRA